MSKRKEKRALVIGEVFHPEDFIINDLVREWERRGYAVEVLTHVPSYPYGKTYVGYKNKLYQTTLFGTVRVHRCPFLPGYQKSLVAKILNYLLFMLWGCVVALCIGRRFDRVFIYQAGPLTVSVAGILMKKFYKTRITIWTQDLWPETVYGYGFKKTRWLSFCLDRFVGWVYRNCDRILVSCEGFTGRIRRYVPDKEIIFAPNWSLMEYAPKEKRRLPGGFNFTFAGNVGRVQNLDNVVLGFARFVSRHPEAWLNIIGDGSYLVELKTLVEQEKIPNVYFAGRKPLAEMSDWYEASDVLVLSLKDTPLYEIMLPSKFQAYLAARKPVYAVFKGEMKRLVEGYRLGFAAQPSDVDDIARGFEAFLSLSAEDLAAFGRHSSELLEGAFNREKIMEKIDSSLWKE